MAEHIQDTGKQVKQGWRACKSHVRAQEGCHRGEATDFPMSEALWGQSQIRK